MSGKESFPIGFHIMKNGGLRIVGRQIIIAAIRPRRTDADNREVNLTLAFIPTIKAKMNSFI